MHPHRGMRFKIKPPAPEMSTKKEGSVAKSLTTDNLLAALNGKKVAPAGFLCFFRFFRDRAFSRLILRAGLAYFLQGGKKKKKEVPMKDPDIRFK